MQIPFESARLRVRRFCAQDASAYWEMENDAVVRKYMCGPTGVSLEKYKSMIGNGELDNQKLYAVADSRSDVFVGSCFLRDTLIRNQRFELRSEWEFGCFFSRSSIGHGLGKEIIKKLIVIGFDDCNLDIIFAHTKNPAAIHINESLKMTEFQTRNDDYFIMKCDDDKVYFVDRATYDNNKQLYIGAQRP